MIDQHHRTLRRHNNQQKQHRKFISILKRIDVVCGHYSNTTKPEIDSYLCSLTHLEILLPLSGVFLEGVAEAFEARQSRLQRRTVQPHLCIVK